MADPPNGNRMQDSPALHNFEPTKAKNEKEKLQASQLLDQGSSYLSQGKWREDGTVEDFSVQGAAARS